MELNTTCKECHQKRPPRNFSTPTKAYQTFDEFLLTVRLSEGQLKTIKEESLEIIKKHYDDGKDLDNDFVFDGLLAEALDSYALIQAIERR